MNKQNDSIHLTNAPVHVQFYAPLPFIKRRRAIGVASVRPSVLLSEILVNVTPPKPQVGIPRCALRRIFAVTCTVQK